MTYFSDNDKHLTHNNFPNFYIQIAMSNYDLIFYKTEEEKGIE